MPHKVLIADKMSPRAQEILTAAGITADVKPGLGADELAGIIGEYDGVLVRSATKITAPIIARGTRLKVIGRAGIGVDNIDVPAATERGIIVMNTPLGNATTTAEHAIAMMMSVSRQIPQATASMRAGRWDKKVFMGREITGKTLGLVGMGNIGRIVADRAQGLRMKVITFDPFITREAAAEIGVQKVEYDELLARADYITVHTPLNPNTRDLLDAAALAKAKTGVFVINCARGGIVNEQALLEALNSGKVAGAALDVYTSEPPEVDHPLRAHDNVILTPHLGASTHEAQINVAVEVARQAAAYLNDGTLTNAVNAPQ